MVDREAPPDDATTQATLAVFGIAALFGAGNARAAPHAEQEPSDCISDAKAKKFAATDGQIPLGKSTKISWDVRTPGSCGGLRLYIGPVKLGSKKGSKTITPVANTGYSLIAKHRNATKTLHART